MQSGHGAHKTHMLASGVSETLKVEPVRKVIRTVLVGKGGALEKAGNVINLLFEGNWMPIKVQPCLALLNGISTHYHAAMLQKHTNNLRWVLFDLFQRQVKPGITEDMFRGT